MKKGTLIKVYGRLATTVSDSYTRMVYDAQDFDLASAGFNGGTACSYVDIAFNDDGQQTAVNLSRAPWSAVQ